MKKRKYRLLYKAYKSTPRNIITLVHRCTTTETGILLVWKMIKRYCCDASHRLNHQWWIVQTRTISCGNNSSRTKRVPNQNPTSRRSLWTLNCWMGCPSPLRTRKGLTTLILGGLSKTKEDDGQEFLSTARYRLVNRFTERGSHVLNTRYV